MRRVLSICAVMLFGASARAEPLVLVLPTLSEGARPAWLQEVDTRLKIVVRHSGRTTRPFATGDGSCRDADCMAALAQGAGTDVVLGARITSDRGSYALVVDRFDRAEPGTIATANGTCSACTEVQAAEQLDQLAATLLPSLVLPSLVAPATVVDTPVPRPSPHRKRNLEIALGITSAFVVAGAAMIGVGAKADSLDGDPVGALTGTATQRPLLYDTKDAGAALVTTGAVLTVGACIGLGFELYSLLRRDR